MRKSGVILLVAGIFIALGYLLYWFSGVASGMGLSMGYMLRLAFYRMPLSLKAIAIAAIVIGLILALIPIFRRGHAISKEEEIKQVKGQS